jgi:hypothetical protein
MNGPRILGTVCSAILLGALGALNACGTPDEPGTSAQTISAASVSIALQDEGGAQIGEGSGILIAPRLVLTSAHLVAGKARWAITTSDGKTATGVRGLTYDWMRYDSNKSHPRKHDVAVIYLDHPIQLAAYPTLATSKLAAGSKGARVRGTGAAFERVAATLDTVRTFPHAYVTEIPAGETLDTGGAVLDERNHIVGVVSGRGLTTGKLYLARTDALASWIAPKVACATSTRVRTYGTPPPDAGSSSGASGGASGSSSGSSGASGSSSGSSGGATSSGASGSSSGSSGGEGFPNCDDGGGNASGASSSGSPGTPGSSGFSTIPDESGGSSSSGAASSSGNASSSGTSGTPGSSGTSGVLPGSSGTSGTPGSSGGEGSSGTSGTPGSSGTNGIPGSSGLPGSSGATAIPDTPSGSGTGSGGETEVCSGPSDNPDVCPPEPNGCVGSTCGGGLPDETIDYGGCACTGSGDVVVR